MVGFQYQFGQMQISVSVHEIRIPVAIYFVTPDMKTKPSFLSPLFSLYDVCICININACVCEQVTLDCPGSKESPHVDKLVERIFFCSCQPCIKEGGQEGGVMQLYPADNVVETPSLSDTISGAQARPLPPPDTHSHKHAHPHTDHHTLPHTSDGG